MLLSLSAAAFRSKLLPPKGEKPTLTLLDLPVFARDVLGLHGLAIPTEFLAGADRPALNRLLEAADKARCPCLVLLESTPQPFADPDPVKVQAAVERCLRVAQAAHWLGCSAFSVMVAGEATEDAMATAAQNMKPVSRRAERLDLNLCISPYQGLTQAPEKVSELLKKIGGFRVGTLPDFSAAASAADPAQYLRRLVPYAHDVIAPAAPVEVDAPPAPAAKSTKSAKAKPAKATKGRKAKGDAALAEALGVPDDMPEIEAPPAKIPPAPVIPGDPVNYDVAQFMGTLAAVGYEGRVVLDYRGKGDAVAAILRLRDTILRVAGTPTLDEGDDGLDPAGLLPPETEPEAEAEEATDET